MVFSVRLKTGYDTRSRYLYFYVISQRVDVNESHDTFTLLEILRFFTYISILLLLLVVYVQEIGDRWLVVY